MSKAKKPRTKKATATRPHPPDDRRQRFIVEYLVDQNATQAARRAGYSERTAHAQGSRLLRNAGIADAIRQRQAARLERAELTADRVIEELRRLALVDARSFFDDHGNIKPVSELTAEQGAALASFEVLIKNAEAGDRKQDVVHKLKLWDKVRALELLAKYFKLLVDRVQVEEPSFAEQVRPLDDDALKQLEELGDHVKRLLAKGSVPSTRLDSLNSQSNSRRG